MFDRQGRLYLQRRPAWKDIQPGRWDTAVGGHVDWGETVEGGAAPRGARGSWASRGFEAERIARYLFRSERECELVYVHRTVYLDGAVRPGDELDGGRFWSPGEIRAALGSGVFTPISKTGRPGFWASHPFRRSN